MKEQQNGMSVIQLITVRNNRQQESRELWTATCRGKVCLSFPCSAPGLRLSVESQLRIVYLKQKSLWMIPDSGTSLEVLVVLGPQFGGFPAQVQVHDFLLIPNSESSITKKRVTEWHLLVAHL